jgi:hypothetical protein
MSDLIPHLLATRMPRRPLSGTKGARWARKNRKRLNAYRREWRQRKTA